MRLHFFGCSLTHGSEILKVGQNVCPAEAKEFTWPALVSKELNVAHTNHAVWASTNRDITLQFLEQANQHTPGDIYVVAWTWPSRTNFWHQTLSANNHSCIISNNGSIYGDIDDFAKHWQKHTNDIEYSIQSLLNFYTVNSLRVPIVNLFITSWDILFENWISTQQLPDSRFNTVFDKSVIYNTYKNTTKYFNKQGLYYPTLSFKEVYFNQWHWNIAGHKKISKKVLKEVDFLV